MRPALHRALAQLAFASLATCAPLPLAASDSINPKPSPTPATTQSAEPPAPLIIEATLPFKWNVKIPLDLSLDFKREKFYSSDGPPTTEQAVLQSICFMQGDFSAVTECAIQGTIQRQESCFQVAVTFLGEGDRPVAFATAGMRDLGPSDSPSPPPSPSRSNASPRKSNRSASSSPPAPARAETRRRSPRAAAGHGLREGA